MLILPNESRILDSMGLVGSMPEQAAQDRQSQIVFQLFPDGHKDKVWDHAPDFVEYFPAYHPSDSGLLCIDIDKGGDAGLDALIAALGEPVAVFRSRRPGGWHAYFPGSGEEGNGDWSLGEASGEIRSSGGWAICWSREEEAFLLQAPGVEGKPIPDLRPILNSPKRKPKTQSRRRKVRAVCGPVEPSKARPRFRETCRTREGERRLQLTREISSWLRSKRNHLAGLERVLSVARLIWDRMEQKAVGESHPFPETEALAVAESIWVQHRQQVESGRYDEEFRLEQSKRGRAGALARWGAPGSTCRRHRAREEQWAVDRVRLGWSRAKVARICGKSREWLRKLVNNSLGSTCPLLSPSGGSDGETLGNRSCKIGPNPGNKQEGLTRKPNPPLPEPRVGSGLTSPKGFCHLEDLVNRDQQMVPNRRRITRRIRVGAIIFEC